MIVVSRLADFGALRLALLALAAFFVLFAPAPEVRTVVTWPEVVPTLIAPAMAPIVTMVLLLDLLMAKVTSAGEENAAKKARAKRIMLIDALAVAVVVFAYLPFFLALGR